MTRRVLIVEDDEAMAIALRDGFHYEGFDVTLAPDGAAGMKLAASASPDLVILDVMLPKMSGYDLCKQIRRDGNPVPIIMLTARGQEIDKVLGLKLGADDYVTKPFSFMELMARVEALLRRANGHQRPASTYTFGDITVDAMRAEVRRGDTPLELSAREFRLLRYFLDHRGELLTREQLLEAVWGYQSDAFTRTVDMHVAKLRKKIEDTPGDPRWIVTVHRMGYKFADEPGISPAASPRHRT